MCKKNEELLLKEEKIRRSEKLSCLIGTVSVIVLLICFITNQIFNNTVSGIIENFGIVFLITGMVISIIIDIHSQKIALSINHERSEDLKSNPERKVRYISDSKNSLELDLIDFLLTSNNITLTAIFKDEKITLRVESNGQVKEIPFKNSNKFFENFEIVEE